VNEPQSTLPVLSCRPVGARQVLLTLDGRGSNLVESYRAPGQYTRLAFEDGVARPYAIASPPGQGELEFLLKVPEERVPQLCALGPDDRVSAGRAQGPGFPVDKLAGRALWMFAVGSGVAPLRAVIEHLLPRRTEIGDVTLLFGARTRADLAFSERFATWAGHGIAVRPVLSRPEPGWDGLTGYIQDHLPKVLPHPAKAIAFVCGLPEMDKAMQAALLERGVGPDQVFRNY
jgi:NAD(P)H-flavin reductase